MSEDLACVAHSDSFWRLFPGTWCVYLGIPTRKHGENVFRDCILGAWGSFWEPCPESQGVCGKVPQELRGCIWELYLGS